MNTTRIRTRTALRDAGHWLLAALAIASGAAGVVAPLVGLMPAAPVEARALGEDDDPEVVVTPIAYQPFEHGWMLWRKDNAQITVVYGDIKTKTGAACQETYRDTYVDQTYQLPAAPEGRLNPALGFGWLYAGDAQLAKRLGYATAEEASRVAEIHASVDPATGLGELSFTLDEPILGAPTPFVIGQSEEPGLTYCFPRGTENRAVLNTWAAIQRFEHGLMRWRQDVPNRIEVIHFDTQWAPAYNCVDAFRDTWMPDTALNYGTLAAPDRIVPARGFGKVWLENVYVRQSLGYPVEAETGGFAEVTFEPAQVPRFGAVLLRNMRVHLPAGDDYAVRTFFPSASARNATDPRVENGLGTGCRTLLTPHKS